MLYKDKLYKLREEKNIKQKEVASIINVNRSVYGRYENEYQIMPIKHLNTICNYFEVSLDYIFAFNNIKNYPGNNLDIDRSLTKDRLRNWRKQSNITQEKLASILNTSQSTIADYESGKNLIPTPFLYTICKKYHISADYLLGKINEPIFLD